LLQQDPPPDLVEQVGGGAIQAAGRDGGVSGGCLTQAARLLADGRQELVEQLCVVVEPQRDCVQQLGKDPGRAGVAVSWRHRCSGHTSPVSAAMRRSVGSDRHTMGISFAG